MCLMTGYLTIQKYTSYAIKEVSLLANQLLYILDCNQAQCIVLFHPALLCFAAREQKS